MWILISGWQINDFETFSSGSVASWGVWCSRPRWSRLWSLQSTSVWQRCTGSFVSPACLRMFCCVIWARKASWRVVLTMHSWGSFYRSLHLFNPRNLNTLLRLFSDFGVRFLDHILRCICCGIRKPFFGHFGHVQRQVHVGLFQLYTTSLPCHRSRHVEHLQEISCCFKQWDVAITSTMYASVASSKVITACFFHSRWCFSGNLCPEIPELTTSWCSISRTVQTNA